MVNISKLNNLSIVKASKGVLMNIRQRYLSMSLQRKIRAMFMCMLGICVVFCFIVCLMAESSQEGQKWFTL